MYHTRNHSCIVLAHRFNDVSNEISQMNETILTVELHNKALNFECWPNLDQDIPKVESRPINHRHIDKPEGLPFTPINSQLNNDNIDCAASARAINSLIKFPSGSMQG